MVIQIYPPGLQLNKANTTDTEAPIVGFTSFYFYGFVSSSIYENCDVFHFDIIDCKFSVFFDFGVPRRASYSVYTSQLFRFARVCNRVSDFNARNKCLTAKLLQQGYRYYKLPQPFVFNFTADTMS